MDFDFSSDQYLLRDSVRSFLDEQWGPRKLRLAAGNVSPELWKGLCALGLQTLPVPEEFDGAGLGFVDLALVLEEFGRALVPAPMAETILAADIFCRFATPAQRASLLPQINAGACRIAFAHAQAGTGHTASEVTLAAERRAGEWRLRGRKILVPAAQAATHLLVSAKPQDGPAALFICEMKDIAAPPQAHRAIDPDSLLCSVSFDGVCAQPVGDVPDPRALARLLETSTLAAALQMVGIGAAALALAVEYAGQRTQFDRPIGSFQAIKHKCADMLVALESARSAAYYAAWAAAEDDSLLPLAVSMAKAVSGDACRLICNDALQIHGGVGFTWDYDIHFYLKRGKLLEYAFGDASFHRERVAGLVLGASGAGAAQPTRPERKESQMQLVDSQIHLFAPGAEEFATRMQQTLMPPEAVVAEMDAAKVSRAYLVPGNAAANATCVEAARRWPDHFRVMGILGLDKPESRALVADWASSGFIGVRLTFPPYRKVSWLKDGTADWFWPEANRLGLPVMMWAPQQIEEIGKLAERYPSIRFIIDHLNLFVEDKGEVVARAVENLLPLAAHASIAVKLSALAAHSSQAYPFRDMHPHVQRVVEAFGAERCLWGTDLTRKACSYTEAITMFTEHMPFLTAAQLEQIMAGSAARWIGWGAAPA